MQQLGCALDRGFAEYGATQERFFFPSRFNTIQRSSEGETLSDTPSFRCKRSQLRPTRATTKAFTRPLDLSLFPSLTRAGSHSPPLCAAPQPSFPPSGD